MNNQQMRWTRHGADLLLQVRCAVYNGTLDSGFGQRFEPSSVYHQKWRWQPGPQVLDSSVLNCLMSRLGRWSKVNQLIISFIHFYQTQIPARSADEFPNQSERRLNLQETKYPAGVFDRKKLGLAKKQYKGRFGES